jgi:hypothetical protein
MKSGTGPRPVVHSSDATTVANLATKQSAAWGELLLALLRSKFVTLRKRPQLFILVHGSDPLLVHYRSWINVANRPLLCRFDVLPLRLP